MKIYPNISPVACLDIYILQKIFQVLPHFFNCFDGRPVKFELNYFIFSKYFGKVIFLEDPMMTSKKQHKQYMEI